MIPPRLQEISGKLTLTNSYGVTHHNPDAKIDKKDIEYLNGLGVKTDVHDTCIKCQIRQLSKYWDMKDSRLDTTKFNIRCDYIPRTLPAQSVLAMQQMIANSDISQERALMLMKATVDPVAWAELMFGFNDSDKDWRIRSYQKEILRCTSYRMVIRWGRRSGKSFISALKLLHMAFNTMVYRGVDSTGKTVHEGPTIMIVTPYQSQLTNIFNELERLLKRCSTLKEQTTTGGSSSLYVKTPNFRMEFTNGARILGFVSGVGSKLDGSGGGTIRGASADVIYLDEMDMIPEDILDKVILPILLTNGNVRLFATSTPIGKRSKFYNWCINSIDWKEDHLPSSVLPHWESIRYQLESENSKEAFMAEFMALFIEGAFGVFKPRFIWAARQEYSYADSSNPENRRWWVKNTGVRDMSKLIYLIGIDWNKNAGTEYVVVAYDPMQNHFFVVEAVNVSAGEFSGEAWKQEVIRLNYKYKPRYIYADEGYGHTIIDDLKIYAQKLRMVPAQNKNPVEQETQHLFERLVAFNFSQRVELSNPFDSSPIVKSGKEFLVENAVRIFEQQNIWFPAEDTVLKKQLENYVILKRHATTGKPIYGPESAEIADHRLDALILALGAYTLELGAYSKNNLAMSSPEFITKERIEAALENEQGNGWFPIGEQTTAPVTVQLLNIKRGAGNTPVPMRERENKHKPNLFEEIFERATFSPSTSAVDYEYGTPSVGNSRRKEPYSIGRRRR